MNLNWLLPTKQVKSDTEDIAIALMILAALILAVAFMYGMAILIVVSFSWLIVWLLVHPMEWGYLLVTIIVMILYILVAPARSD